MPVRLLSFCWSAGVAVVVRLLDEPLDLLPIIWSALFVGGQVETGER